MAEFEAAVSRTLEEVDVLKSQIEKVLAGLLARKEISEADLVPVLQEQRSGKPSSLSSKLSLRRKTKTQSDYSEFRRQMSSQSQAPPRSQIPPPFFAPELGLLEEETFLIPLLDRWFWGVTIINNSQSPTPLPVLHLTVISEGTRRSRLVFAYNYSISLVDMEVVDQSQGSFDIPIQTTLGNKEEQLKSGCKAKLTASFANPVSLYNSENSLRIRATLFLSGKFQLSRMIDIQLEDSFRRFNDFTYKKHRSQIFSALSHNTHESFRLGRLRPECSPLPSFKAFLASLGFENLFTAQLGPEITIDCLAHDVPSLLYGLLVKMEWRALERDNPVFCTVSARTPSQMAAFCRLATSWFKKEYRADKRIGLKLPKLSASSSEEFTKTLLKEIEVLIHLSILSQHNFMDSDEKTRSWLNVYIQAMTSTDKIFMQQMRLKA